MTQAFCALSTRSLLVALMLLLTAGTGIATAAPQTEKPSGPIQDFDWLLDSSLLKDDHNDDDDDDDDDDEVEAGEVIIRENRRTTTTTVTQVSYTDLTANYWASNFIYRLSAIEVVEGFPSGQFLPANRLTQAQYAAMVARAFDMPSTRQYVLIRNVPSSYWAYRAIQSAYSMGFININNGVFNPDASLTRLDMLVSLARGLNITQVSAGQSVDALLSGFSDAASIPSEYRVIIAALVERGIIVNYPQVRTLNLFETVTRAEACGFVYQALVYLDKVEAVNSTYIADIERLYESTTTTVETETTETTTVDSVSDDDDDDDDDDEDDDDDDRRQNCNQGIGNGAEGCDPGNSRPHGGSNDETGRTPGNR